jgi:hypothetical protein
VPNHFSIDINKRPFYLAGQKVEAIAFLVGEQRLQMGVRGCAVDTENAVGIQLLPEHARQIARELMNMADKDQVKRIIKQAKEAVGE